MNCALAHKVAIQFFVISLLITKNEFLKKSVVKIKICGKIFFTIIKIGVHYDRF